MKAYVRLAVGVVLFGSAASCVTTAQKEKMENDIFTLQTRLLQLESRQKGGSETQAIQSRTLATSTSTVEKHDLELRRITGELEAIKIGVVTGELPGTAESSPSVAKSIKELETRLAAIEEEQKAIVKALEAAGQKRGGKPEKSENKAVDKAIASVSDLKKAYDEKKYKAVVADAPAILGKASKSDKSEGLLVFAESLFKLNKLRDAALRYNEYLETGATTQLAHVKMRMGDCFRALGDKSTAKVYYEELVNQYPSTAEAIQAKEQLAKL